jgi:hypothetical protein
VTVTLRSSSPCVLCGFRFRVFMVATVRVNKRSMRTIGPSLGAIHPHACPECGSPSGGGGAAPRSPYVLDPKDAVRVAEYRAKRWGVGTGEAPVERAS